MDPVAVTLEEAATLALRTGTRMVEPPAVEAACRQRGLDREQWFAALVELKNRRLIQLASAEPSTTAVGNTAGVMLIALTNAGVLEHLGDVDAVSRLLASAVTALVGQGPADLAGQLDEPALLVEVLLDTWVEQRRIVYSKAPGRRFRVHRIVGELPGAPAAAPEAATGGATSAEPTRP